MSKTKRRLVSAFIGTVAALTVLGTGPAQACAGTAPTLGSAANQTAAAAELHAAAQHR
jgi:hypothetical protein